MTEAEAKKNISDFPDQNRRAGENDAPERPQRQKKSTVDKKFAETVKPLKTQNTASEGHITGKGAA